jgi:hypothetical protein
MEMNRDHDETATEATEVAEKTTAADPTITAQRARASDDFLVPGPTPDSNVGLRQWGCTWLAFSLILILLMLGLSFVCLTLANWTGFA